MFDEILKLDKYNFDESKFFSFCNNEDFGELKSDDKNFSFIDLIKGIFPMGLSDFLKDELKMNLKDRIQISTAYLASYLNFIYDETKIIWNKRCDIQIKKEKLMKVSKKDKLNAKKEGTVIVIRRILEMFCKSLTILKRKVC